MDVSIQIRYRINDVIKMTNTIQDFNTSLKAMARGILVNFISKKDAGKIEIEINYIKQEFVVSSFNLNVIWNSVVKNFPTFLILFKS